MDTKVHYQTSATLNQSELQFRSSEMQENCLTILFMINHTTKFCLLIRTGCGYNPQKCKSLHPRQWTVDPFHILPRSLVKWG